MLAERLRVLIENRSNPQAAELLLLDIQRKAMASMASMEAIRRLMTEARSGRARERKEA